MSSRGQQGCGATAPARPTSTPSPPPPADRVEPVDPVDLLLQQLRIRHADGDPPALRSWWSGVSDVERQALIIDSPALVGAAAGVPPRHRDEANRLRLLAEHLVALTESGWDLAALAGVRDRAGAPTAMVGWWGSAVALHALLDGLRATRPTAAATTGSIRPFPT